MTRRVRIANHSLKVPGSPRARRVLGAALVIGGILGFLPILGFWMIPLGIAVIAIDLAQIWKSIRRHR